MKKYLTLIAFLTLVSCSKKDLDKYDAHEYEIEVTFNNGDKDTVTVVGDRLSIQDGDFRVSDGFYTDTFASGVRTYKILKTSDVYNKNGQIK